MDGVLLVGRRKPWAAGREELGRVAVKGVEKVVRYFSNVGLGGVGGFIKGRRRINVGRRGRLALVVAVAEFVLSGRVEAGFVQNLVSGA